MVFALGLSGPLRREAGVGAGRARFASLPQAGLFHPSSASLVEAIVKKSSIGIQLPGVSDRRPVAFPIETAPKSPEPVFVYSPPKGEWTVAVRGRGLIGSRVKRSPDKRIGCRSRSPAHDLSKQTVRLRPHRVGFAPILAVPVACCSAPNRPFRNSGCSKPS